MTPTQMVELNLQNAIRVAILMEREACLKIISEEAEGSDPHCCAVLAESIKRRIEERGNNAE